MSRASSASWLPCRVAAGNPPSACAICSAVIPRISSIVFPVIISVSREAGKPIVRVRDTGIGVEPAERDKIFQRFYRTSSGHRVPGSGLGLSITAAIASLHEFELRFDDNHPGAVFELVGRA